MAALKRLGNLLFFVTMKAKLLIVFFIVFSFSSAAQDWKVLSDSLIYYYSQKDFDKALPWAEKATVATKEKFGVEDPVYASYLTMLAGLYISTQQHSKAIPVLSESLSIYKKNVGENHKNFIQTLNLLAATYSGMGQNNKAEPLFIQLTAIYKNKYGGESNEYAASLNKLGKVYEEMGQYAMAEPLFIGAAAIRKKIQGEKDPDYATSLNNLALLYKSMGEYAKAEPLLMKALTIRKEKFGENSFEYANSSNNLASLYETLGQYGKAEPLYIQAVNIFKEKAGGNNPDYATSLSNLAQIYQSTGEFTKAEELLTRVLQIQKKILGQDHPAYFITLNNLAGNYLFTGQYKKAEQLYLEAIESEKRILGEKHPDYARSFNDLAYLYRREEKYKEAEALYIQAIAIFKEMLGEKHPEYAAALNNLAVLYESMGQYDKAEKILSQTKTIETNNLLNVFSVLSEKEKADYIIQQSSLNNTANSFLYNYAEASPSFYAANYDLQLLIKGLSLSDTKNAMDAVRNSSDTTVRQLFARWQHNKIVLAKQYSLPVASRRDDLAGLEEQTEQAEKELNHLSAAFRNQQQSTGITWNDVQKNLQADEAAIEFVSFKLYHKDWTDSIIYAAYLVRKNDPAPLFIFLTEENRLQQLINSAGKNQAVLVKRFYPGAEIKNKQTGFLGDSLYKLIWQPLEPYLNGIKKISYSPAGKLYSIAFNALTTTDSGVLLIDKYKLAQYTSTRQVALRTKNSEAIKPQAITLFGNASFTMDSLQLIKQKRKQPGEVIASVYTVQKASNDNVAWRSLPGTAEEINKIKQLFAGNKINSKSFIQTSASEDNLKALSGHSPQVLHIATHGFFLPEADKKKKERGAGPGSTYTLANDPLLRSGLMLAGCNYAWSGKIPIDGVEDGIATAYEICQLNLSNTELVVLSACETALGDIKGSEGVFGLQRAFKMAGIKKMIVSLWRVPDKETAELMTTFYTYWMKGKIISDAFAQAQADMRKKYAPFYWAAFVLVE